jgi:hypothetical protein
MDMSALDTLEMDLLLKAALHPKRKSAAERKRDQRKRAKAAKANGRPILDPETLSVAILDAVSIILREGDPFGRVDCILRYAASGFACPTVAARAMKKRLLARPSKMVREG